MTRRDSRASLRPTWSGALIAEALKLWTLLSNRILLAVAVLIIVGSGSLFSMGLVSRLTDPRFAGQAVGATPLQFVDSVLWAQIVVAILGVLAVTSEYASGQVRLSLLALPTRLPWLGAKALVLTVAGFLVGVIGTAISLGGSVFALTGTGVHYDPELSEITALCLRSGLYLAAIAAFAVGLTAVLRHVVAGLVSVLALLIVVPPVLSSIPGIGRLADYTPTSAGRRLISDYETIAQLTPWAGFGVLVAWTLAALLAAGILLRARDA
ncbi:ABC-2 type transport system permease protein [Microbacterium resistens]|uniref:ABC-2 type transport system permease protein n=1 Tax=Microbacterium resistens TaxID=156977 RepID=A0ABU1SEA9_9MICO|nr:hypothetical protein [Microbacterium resistens]MDR6867904.1 ABC-2 type transport system permease protein [Microbacterium resistens]